MAIEEKQALVLEQPKDQKVYLDLQHSTDWVVVISVIASALISFIGFLITKLTKITNHAKKFF